MNGETRALYVEDEPQSRTILQVLLLKRLKLAGLTCFSDSEDFEVRVRALEPHPDIVFLDIHVKPLDGFAMLRILRGMERFKDVPVVALTASVMNEEIAMLREAGFDGCLAKPLDVGTFPDTFRRLLSGETVWNVVA